MPKRRVDASFWHSLWEEAQEPVFQKDAAGEIAFGAAVSLGAFCFTVAIVGLIGMLTGPCSALQEPVNSLEQRLQDALHYSVSAGAQISAAILLAPALLAVSIAQLLRSYAGDAYALLLARARVLYWSVGAALGGMSTLVLLWLGVSERSSADALLTVGTVAPLLTCYVVAAVHSHRRRIAMILWIPGILLLTSGFWYATSASAALPFVAAVPFGIWSLIVAEAILATGAIVCVLPVGHDAPGAIVREARRCVAAASASPDEQVALAAVEEARHLLAESWSFFRRTRRETWMSSLAYGALLEDGGMTAKLLEVAARWYACYCSKTRPDQDDRWIRIVFPCTAPLSRWKELVDEIISSDVILPPTLQEIIARVLADYLWAHVCSPPGDRWDNPWRSSISEIVSDVIDRTCELAQKTRTKRAPGAYIPGISQACAAVASDDVPAWVKNAFGELPCRQTRLERWVGALLYPLRWPHTMPVGPLTCDVARHLHCVEQVTIDLVRSLATQQAEKVVDEQARWALRLCTEIAAAYVQSASVEALRRFLFGDAETGNEGLVGTVRHTRPALIGDLASGLLYMCCQLWAGEQQAILPLGTLYGLDSSQRSAYRRCFGEILRAAKAMVSYVAGSVEDVIFGTKTPLAFLPRQQRLGPHSSEYVVAFAALVRGLAGLGGCTTWQSSMADWICPVCSDPVRWRITVWAAAFRGVNEYLLALDENRLHNPDLQERAICSRAVRDVLRSYKRLAARHCPSTSSPLVAS